MTFVLLFAYVASTTMHPIHQSTPKPIDGSTPKPTPEPMCSKENSWVKYPAENPVAALRCVLHNGTKITLRFVGFEVPNAGETVHKKEVDFIRCATFCYEKGEEWEHVMYIPDEMQCYCGKGEARRGEPRSDTLYYRFDPPNPCVDKKSWVMFPRISPFAGLRCFYGNETLETKKNIYFIGFEVPNAENTVSKMGVDFFRCARWCNEKGEEWEHLTYIPHAMKCSCGKGVAKRGEPRSDYNTLYYRFW